MIPHRRPVYGEPAPPREEILRAIADETEVSRLTAASELAALEETLAQLRQPTR